MQIKAIDIQNGIAHIEICGDDISDRRQVEKLKISEKSLLTAASVLGDITAGSEICEEQYDELHRLSEGTEALLEAARILSGGDHSRRELKTKLKRKFSDEAADRAVKLMLHRGYLDEERSCLRYAEEAVLRRHYGPRRIKAELIKRGYGTEDADNAVRSVPDEDYDNALGYLIDRKYHGAENIGERETASLARMGYTISMIERKIKEIDHGKKG